MGLNCCVEGCTGGWINGAFHAFRFKLCSDVYAKWVAFVNKRNWAPSNAVICFEHFEDKYIIRGERWTLNWSLLPVPTKFPPKTLKRKTLNDINFDSYRVNDKNGVNFDDLDSKYGPDGFEFRKQHDHVLYFKLEFDCDTGFPYIKEAIKIDDRLHVKLQYKNSPMSLPAWFFNNGTHGKLRSLDQIQLLADDMVNRIETLDRVIMNF